MLRLVARRSGLAIQRTQSISAWTNTTTRALLSTLHKPENVRNVAVIAHIDHGKTTLVDKLMKDTQGFAPETDRLMDSMNLEKERGITIMSKYCRVDFEDEILNIVDTPGHSDFGGEVERILSIVDGVILVVDATEGPMAQTKFVLSKAIEQNLKPIVVLNKVDRPTCRVSDVENEVLELFLNLDASEEQLDYTTLYASAKEGWAVADLDDIDRSHMRPLLRTIVDSIPPPCTSKARDSSFAMAVNSIQTDNFVGRVVMGKIHTGRVKVGNAVKVMSRDGSLLGQGKVQKLFCQRGMDKHEIEEAGAGDILWLAGVEAGVSDTIAAADVSAPLFTQAVDPPTISMTFGANDSPLAGKEGKFVTGSHVVNRLLKETENNVSIQLVESTEPESIEVHGRGELQLGILIETMRREEYELAVSPPKVLTKKCSTTGKVLEPVEEVIIDVEQELSGVVVEKMSARKGLLVDFKDHRGKARLIFHVPSRGLLGLMTEMRTETRGSAIVNRAFLDYRENAGVIEGMFKGKLISMERGIATAYALNMLEDRGVLFIEPGVEVYPGMVIGEHSRPVDLDVNPTKAKKMSNVRSVNADEAIRLAPPVKRSLEELIAYMAQDEKLEATPSKLRLRKKEMDAGLRARMAKAGKK